MMYIISLLARIFIANREDTKSPAVRRAYGSLCGIVGIILNLFLFAGKFLAGTLSGSIAVCADAFNNLSDAGSSLIALLGFRLAARRPDPEHPFGHGRMEYISGLIVSLLILLMGFELFKSSVEKLLTPEPAVFSMLTVIILICSIAVKLYMYFYNHKIAKLINSAAMQAIATDSLSDTVSTAVVLLTTLIGKWTGFDPDAYCGLAVACFILYEGFNTAKETITPLLGQPPQPGFIEEVKCIIRSYPEILGIHDLIVNDYGPGRLIVSLHAEVSSESDILVIHDVIDRAELALHDRLGCIAVIHMDPIVTGNTEIDTLYEKLMLLVKDMDERITLHDFRMVPGTTHTNIIFDAVLPFDSKWSSDAFQKKISDAVRSINDSYRTVVNIDRPFTAKGDI